MKLEIFDVEHGACALLTADNNTRLMIDCGSSATWQPGTHLRCQGVRSLEMLAITNYDEDHASGLPNLLDNVHVQWLWRNESVTPQQICALKSEDGMANGIRTLVGMAGNYQDVPGVAPLVFPGVERRAFWNTFPRFDDENNLSMVVFLSIHGKGFLFPGDLEEAGWLNLLQLAEFRDAVARTHVLLASHHGRESGICTELFDKHNCRPYYVVISDKGYMYSTQECVPYYRSKAIGGPFRGETRHVLTTRNDGHITFTVNPDSWGPYS
jgi:beta-lactamase superfamily II metal-dependent hydrolase